MNIKTSAGQATRSSRRKQKVKDSGKRWKLGIGKIEAGPFSMGGAYIDSRSDRMVGLSEFSSDIQTVMPRITTELGGKFGTMDVLSGTEFLTALTNPETGAEPGDILAAISLNPRLLTNTRLSQFSDLYERYRFRKMNICYKATANATQSGQLIGYGDYDPDNVLTVDSPSNLSTAAAHLGQEVCKVWESKRFPFGIVDDYTTLFVDPATSDLRLAIQGVYYILAASDLLAEISSLGNLYIEYEIEFYIPILSIPVPENSSVSAQYLSDNPNPTPTLPFGVSPDAGWTSFSSPSTLLTWPSTTVENLLEYNSSELSSVRIPSAVVGDKFVLCVSVGMSVLLEATILNVQLVCDHTTNCVMFPLTVQTDTVGSSIAAAPYITVAAPGGFSAVTPQNLQNLSSVYFLEVTAPNPSFGVTMNGALSNLQTFLTTVNNGSIWISRTESGALMKVINSNHSLNTVRKQNASRSSARKAKARQVYVEHDEDIMFRNTCLSYLLGEMGRDTISDQQYRRGRENLKSSKSELSLQQDRKDQNPAGDFVHVYSQAIPAPQAKPVGTSFNQFLSEVRPCGGPFHLGKGPH